MKIAQNSKGDVRSAINDLQSISEENQVLTLQDTMALSSRNKDISMDETLRGFFSAKSVAEASSLLSRSSVDYDDFLLSVSDNLPRRYTDPESLLPPTILFRKPMFSEEGLELSTGIF